MNEYKSITKKVFCLTSWKSIVLIELNICMSWTQRTWNGLLDCSWLITITSTISSSCQQWQCPGNTHAYAWANKRTFWTFCVALKLVHAYVTLSVCLSVFLWLRVCVCFTVCCDLWQRLKIKIAAKRQLISQRLAGETCFKLRNKFYLKLTQYLRPAMRARNYFANDILAHVQLKCVFVAFWHLQFSREAAAVAWGRLRRGHLSALSMLIYLSLLIAFYKRVVSHLAHGQQTPCSVCFVFRLCQPTLRTTARTAVSM